MKGWKRVMKEMLEGEIAGDGYFCLLRDVHRKGKAVDS